MKTKYYFFLTLVLIGNLTSCKENLEDILPEDIGQLTLLPPSIATTTTRSRPVDGTFFPWYTLNFAEKVWGSSAYINYYNIGFCIYNHDGGTQSFLSPHMNGYENLKRVLTSIKYKADNRLEQEWDSPINARIEKSIDIYAYYPWIDKEFQPDKVPFTTTDQIDWMWADPIHTTVQSSNSNNVSLNFHHAMTCLEIRLSALYENTINLYSISLKDKQKQLTAGGTMDISTGVLTYVQDQESITIKGDNTNNNLLPVHNSENTSYFSYSFLIPEKSFSPGDLTLSFVYDYVNSKEFSSGYTTYVVPILYKKSTDGSDYVLEKDTEDKYILKTAHKYILNLVIDNANKITPLSMVAVDGPWQSENIELKI